MQHMALSVLCLKGSISEFEISVLRSRMFEAVRAKARRGELRISVPIGYVRHRELGLDFDPDQRLQEVIRLIFSRFREIGSARQYFWRCGRRRSTSRGPPMAGRWCRSTGP